jgi:hypothetical protein
MPADNKLSAVGGGVGGGAFTGATFTRIVPMGNISEA